MWRVNHVWFINVNIQMLAWEHIHIIMWGLPKYARIGNSWNQGDKINIDLKIRMA